MEKITQVTEADVGRIAVSEDGYFRVKILKADGNESTVEFLKDTSLREKFDVSQGFGLINGARTMYWEETAKPSKPMTAFENWCTEKGYDPKGWFTYDMDLSQKEEFSFGAKKKFKLVHDDNTPCPRFQDDSGFEHYEYFNSEHSGVVMKQDVKVKVAKPRFHKKRQKPPVRQKTDVVIQYKTGQSYTIKNAKSVSIDKHQVVITTLLKIESGIYSERSYTIESNLVNIVEVKAPKNEDFEVHNFDENDFSVFFDSGFAVVSQWFKSF